MDKHARPVFAKIEALPHGPSSEPFVHIVMTGEIKKEHRATLHHTFDTCFKELKHLTKQAYKHSLTSVVEAKDIKAGDCLHTTDGPANVRTVKRVPVKMGDMTYSIGLEDNIGTVTVGGAFAHAMGFTRLHAHDSGTNSILEDETAYKTKAKVKRGSHFHLP
jgi:hypothetical protein